ncbi:MAG TPA: hypothetical protein VNN10_14255 [Dehalococcoidia bacterium]|nr:hypothetical protein [Dehalococcoidia bacterium]
MAKKAIVGDEDLLRATRRERGSAAGDSYNQVGTMLPRDCRELPGQDLSCILPLPELTLRDAG